MCGINGIISSKYSSEQLTQTVQKMNNILAHRGPDNEGIWSKNIVSLGHRRLSIIDVSEQGNQPFFSQDKRYVIVYNGELYNYKQLKLDLQRSSQGEIKSPWIFNTNSDTEVVLAAFIRWGSKCLQLFNGMFAFAIYDSQLNKLFIARDKLGVKPLYYHYSDDVFMFSSEIRPIISSGIKTFSLNKDALPEYMMYQTVMAPNTIIKSIKMLMPGHYLEVENQIATITQYYSLHSATNNLNTETTYLQAKNKVFELLSSSVERRMISDVPFGAFLSGGIDSSAVVALMSKISSQAINTFNITFDESEFSESTYAKIISKKFNTKHHEIKLTPNDFLNQLPLALKAMDHPSGDGPNTFIVSQATKKEGVTMALSGIGGDELFAGYNVFKQMKTLSRKNWINMLPLFSRKIAGTALHLKNKNIQSIKTKELLEKNTIDFYAAYPLSRALFPNKLVQQFFQNSTPYASIEKIISAITSNQNSVLKAVSQAEIETYLQNILLRDTDQMSMAVALEIREPFLDFHLVEFVLSLPDDLKYPHSPKKLLVESLENMLPSEIVNRPKMGFTLPWQHWLKNELKTFCEEQLNYLIKLELFDKKELLNLWQLFLNNSTIVTWSRVWHIVCLGFWLNENNVEV
ncbi:MAG: asparagine synthase (glutamine-hydrolyzing) [Bacteroidetes bacterium]|nr:asparagine synthase (glutamine-hydrolyzing) [Bacteroidota bacterium]